VAPSAFDAVRQRAEQEYLVLVAQVARKADRRITVS
jgi:hypothetical protein